MTITGPQKFGLAMGIIPGFNFIASVAKFFHYRKNEIDQSTNSFETEVRIEAARKAASVDKVAQKALQNIENDMPNLKWFALLQFIPVIGIIFAKLEYDLLKRVNIVFNDKVDESKPKDSATKDSAPVEQDEKPLEVKPPLTIDLDDYTNITKRGKVAIFVYRSGTDGETNFETRKREFEKAAGELDTVQFASLNTVYYSKEDLEKVLGGSPFKPTIVIYKDGQQKHVMKDVSGTDEAAIIRMIRAKLGLDGNFDSL